MLENKQTDIQTDSVTSYYFRGLIIISSRATHILNSGTQEITKDCTFFRKRAIGVIS